MGKLNVLLDIHHVYVSSFLFLSLRKYHFYVLFIQWKITIHWLSPNPSQPSPTHNLKAAISSIHVPSSKQNQIAEYLLWSKVFMFLWSTQTFSKIDDVNVGHRKLCWTGTLLDLWRNKLLCYAVTQIGQNHISTYKTQTGHLGTIKNLPS